MLEQVGSFLVCVCAFWERGGSGRFRGHRIKVMMNDVVESAHAMWQLDFGRADLRALGGPKALGKEAMSQKEKQRAIEH